MQQQVFFNTLKLTNIDRDELKDFLIWILDCIEVKESLIFDAGQGAFAKKDILQGEVVDIYWGRPPMSEEMNSSYLYEFEDKTSIIPDIKCKSRYINDIIDLNNSVNAGFLIYRNELKYNVAFGEFKGVCFIVAINNIVAGEELYIDYHPTYWASMLSNSRLTQKTDENELKRTYNHLLLTNLLYNLQINL